MSLVEDKNPTTPSVDDPQTLIRVEYEDVSRALKEITLMLEQSRVEVGKLTQRNAAVTAHLQQIQNQLASLPHDEVRQVYDSALDAQQRLFVMRNQLEKLQNDQSHFERNRKFLERIQQTIKSTGNQGKGDKSTLTSVAMLVNAQEAERQRLSRQMHDGPAQALSNFILQTEIAMRLLDVDANQARNELVNLKTSAMSTFQKVRNFIFELRPMMLDDLGLAPTIRRYVDSLKEQSGVDITLMISGTDRRLESYIEVMLFRGLQELLGNAVNQHQSSVVKIQLDFGEANIRLSMDDNGKGYEADALSNESNIGINLIKERAEMLGGSLVLDSTPGLGTRLSLVIPTHGK